VLRVHHILVRHPGSRFGVKQMPECTKQDLEGVRPEAAQGLAVTSPLTLLDCLRPQITTLEQAVTPWLKHTPASQQ
jgi:hypothetical protein